MIGRRSFFTAIGAAVAAMRTAQASEGGEIVFSPNSCILCGFDQPDQLKPWESRRHPGVMRCSDRMGCQSRQIDALLGTLTPWQERTGIVMAKGKARS